MVSSSLPAVGVLISLQCFYVLIQWECWAEKRRFQGHGEWTVLGLYEE